MNHIDHILKIVPDLGQRRILDLGSGRGTFLVDAAKRKYVAEGIEYNPRYIKTAQKRAEKEGVDIAVIEGAGESLPYEDNSFGFINAAEVLEHVQDPDKVVSEMSRVMTKDGIAYVSIPNRFGFFDPHFHVHFVNWLPRFLSDPFLFIFGKQKDYSKSDAGYQRLSEMHYMTRHQFEKLCSKHNLYFFDSRERKIIGKFPTLSFLLAPLYRFYAFFFISTYHGLIKKNP